MKRIILASRPLAAIAFMLLAGCGGSSSSAPAPDPAPLSANNINLIFVVSEDLAFHTDGDINQDTANLTSRGLARSLKMASFLRQRVLGMKNVTRVYALEPMTHLQNSYPDLVSAETVQQFALLNQVTLSSAKPPQLIPYTGNSYPLNTSYADGSVPPGVATPTTYCGNCQGLDFNDTADNNENLVTGIITAGVPGFYVFSSSWETTSALMAKTNEIEGYKLDLPSRYEGPNYIYAISITATGSASLVTYHDDLTPASGYLSPSPKPVISTQCTEQQPFTISLSGGYGGASIPPGINTNETVYMIRHADAHPNGDWDDGNYICAGQWRALDLPNALRGKINPDEVYSIDPAQVSVGTEGALGNSYSYVRATLTAEPYAIANNLPYGLAASFELFDPDSPELAGKFFFFTNASGPNFSNKTVLLAWEHDHIPPTVNWLISTYFTSESTPPSAPDWPSDDYDTIWTVKLDRASNLTVNNAMCEGIDSAKLPATCPEF
jgi:hypothetical protein